MPRLLPDESAIVRLGRGEADTTTGWSVPARHVGRSDRSPRPASWRALELSRPQRCISAGRSRDNGPLSLPRPTAIASHRLPYAIIHVGGMCVGPAVSVGSPAQQDGRSSAARTACPPNGIAARSRASGANAKNGLGNLAACGANQLTSIVQEPSRADRWVPRLSPPRRHPLQLMTQHPSVVRAHGPREAYRRSTGGSLCAHQRTARQRLIRWQAWARA